MTKKNIVVIGGGNGSAMVLAALKKFSEQLTITAIISSADSGASSGKLRSEFGMVPPGDILRATLALSKYDYTMLHTIFRDNRFTDGALKGANLGNIFLALAAQYTGDFSSAVAALGHAVEAAGTVVPATLMPSELHVTLANGQEIVSEGNIDRPSHDRSSKITKAWLDPIEANPAAITAIRSADYIIIGPGSLYTSLIPALLPSGMKEALAETPAKIWYGVSRGFETNGEAGPEKLSDCVEQLSAYLPRPLDGVVYNNHAMTDSDTQIYAEKKWQPLELDAGAISGIRVIGADFETDCSQDPEKFAPVIRQLLQLA